MRPRAEIEGELVASTAIPITRVHVIFNGENVWANLQKPSSMKKTKIVGEGIMQLDFDLDDTNHWRPLFTPQAPFAEFEILGETLPMQTPLIYKAADESKANALESRLRDQIETKLVGHRSSGEGGLPQMTTYFNHTLERLLRDICDQLEKYSNCHRNGGTEAIAPLRPVARAPVTFNDLMTYMRRVEEQNQGTVLQERSMYGIPINLPYTDFNDLWQAVLATGIVEMGQENSEYAIGLRVYAYPSRVMSIWIFIACTAKD